MAWRLPMPELTQTPTRNGGIIPAAMLNQRLNLDMQLLKLHLRDADQKQLYDRPRLLEEIRFEVKGKKILLVEDNNDFRHYLQEELRRHFVVFEASDGEEGEAVALQQKPDIIITDLMMPKMDGIELCKRIKHNIDVSHIPIILLTASASVENEERGYKEGADAYMTKPFKWEILTARIHNLLAQRRQQQNEFKQNAEAEAKDVTISPADEDFLNKALRFVEKNMDNSEYSVDELSDDMAMSRATLFRKMRSVIGMSPTDFIRNTRLKRAAQLITEGRLSVTEIAYSVGYSSPGHFTKSFKKEFGVLPTQYHKT